MDSWELWERQLGRNWSFSHEAYEEFLSCMKTGDIVRGFVLQPVDEHRTIVSIKGHNVVADCGRSWPKGTRFVARVTGLQPKVVLRLEPEENSGALDARLRRILRELGLPAGEDALLAARILDRGGLAITRESVEAALELLAELTSEGDGKPFSVLA